MPTSTAQLALGQFAERAGKVQVAQQYYAMAAQARGSDADKARQGLMRLQPAARSDTPGGFEPVNARLLVRQGLSRDGEFIVQLVNQTSLPIGGIELTIQTAPGTPQQVQSVAGVIRPGKQWIHRTGRKLSAQQAQRTRVTVSSAVTGG